jgi:hypothetical protein
MPIPHPTVRLPDLGIVPPQFLPSEWRVPDPAAARILRDAAPGYYSSSRDSKRAVAQAVIEALQPSDPGRRDHRAVRKWFNNHAHEFQPPLTPGPQTPSVFEAINRISSHLDRRLDRIETIVSRHVGATRAEPLGSAPRTARLASPGHSRPMISIFAHSLLRLPRPRAIMAGRPLRPAKPQFVLDDVN